MTRSPVWFLRRRRPGEGGFPCGTVAKRRSRETSPSEGGPERGLESGAQCGVRVAHPRDGGFEIEGRVERRAVRRGHDHAGFRGDERRAHVVRMTREPRGLAAPLE